MTNLEILGRIRHGTPPAEIAKELVKSGSADSAAAARQRVEKLLADASQAGLLPELNRTSHEDRRARRKQMAEAVASGKAVAEVAEDFGAAENTVKNACDEFDVEYRTSRGRVNQYEVLARLIAGESQAEIAERLGCHRQSIWQIATRAKEAGVFAAVKRARKRAW